MKPANVTVVLVLVGAAIALYFFLPKPSNVSTGSGAQTVPLTNVSYRVLLEGEESNINDRVNYVIRSSTELRQLWNLISTANDIPDIDFSKEMVVAVFAGQEPTAGYKVGVSNVGDSASARVVEVTIVKPGGSCSVAQKISTPFQIVVFAKTALPLTHTDTTKVFGCINQAI